MTKNWKYVIPAICAVFLNACADITIVDPKATGSYVGPAASISVPLNIEISQSVYNRSFAITGGATNITSFNFTSSVKPGSQNTDVLSASVPLPPGSYTFGVAGDYDNWLGQRTPISQSVNFQVSATTPMPAANMVQANAVLTKVGKFAEDSFYACLLNGYMQGLRLPQLVEECATKLIEDDKKGFGEALGNIGGQQNSFEPSEVTAACNSGDPTHSQSSGGGNSSGNGYKGEYGLYSWGGDPNKYWGMNKEESERQKNENIREEKVAYAEFNKLEAEALKKENEVNDAKAKGDTAAAAKAEEELKAAKEAANEAAAKDQEANEKARQDPNKKPDNVGRPVAGNSPCEEAMQSANEFLRECHRTHWKNIQCQQLQAKANGCPDPTLILVDPEQGYSCGVKPDAETIEAAKKASVARCKERVKFGPDGPNPCEPPSIDASGRYLKGKMGDVCNDPHAYINPDSEVCFATFDINKKPFGAPDIQQIIVVIMNKYGGPLIVIPSNPKSPRPGSDPRPGPKP